MIRQLHNVMPMFLNKVSIFIFLFLFNTQLRAQTGPLQAQNDTTFTLIGDTIFSNQDFKIYIGQRLVIGSASGERDWYETISFKSGASWPLLLMKKEETNLNQEYQLDPSIREKDKVKTYLSPGDTLIVTKIKKYGKKRFGYHYIISMGHKQGFLSLNFKCNIIEAIRRREVLLPIQ